MKQEGYSARDVATYVPWSYKWDQRRWKEFQEDDEHQNVVSQVEEAIA